MFATWAMGWQGKIQVGWRELKEKEVEPTSQCSF